MSLACDCCGATSWTPLFSENGLTLGRCSGCGLLSIDQMPDSTTRMTEMEEGHYADQQEILSASRQLTMEQGSVPRFQRYIDAAHRHAPTGRWLDIGCGVGLLPHLAAQRGYDAEGIELNGERRALAAGSGLIVHGAPLEDLQLPTSSYDVVSMVNVFSHLVSPRRTLREIARVLRQDGVLVMVTGEMDDGVQHRDQRNWNLGDHLRFLGAGTIERYAEELDFDIVEHRKHWLPDEMYNAEWLRAPGRDQRINAVKAALARTPGGLRLVRAVMLRRHADSKAHTSTFVLRFA